ncbi:MAG: acyltransferase family protein [Enterococcus sp.]
MSQKIRDPFFDNAKFMLMFLVILGHLLQPFTRTNQLYHNLYFFIFLFHMPAFILISGFFAKSFAQRGSVKNLVRKIGAPYLVFQFVYSIYYVFIGVSDTLTWNFLNPRWSLWFLVSLFWWQLSLSLFKRLTPIQGIPLSVLLSLGAGYLPFLDQTLAAQRTFTFLPFFIIGFYLSNEQVTHWRKMNSRLLAIGFLPLLYLFVQQTEQLKSAWVFGSLPYSEFLQTPSTGALLRFVMLVLGLLGTIGFLSLVPQKTTFFTKWGKNTLAAYLLQGFFIKGLRVLDIPTLHSTILGLALLLLLGLVLTTILSSEWVQNHQATLKRTCHKITHKIA